MEHTSALGLALILCLTSSFQPCIRQKMEFHGESELRVEVEVWAEGGVRLVWPIDGSSVISLGPIKPSGYWEAGEEGLRAEILTTNVSRGALSFSLSFPLEDGRTHAFPVPSSSPNLPIIEYGVLLPEGWTTDSAGVQKRLDGEGERIGLMWERPEQGSGARLLQPGSRAAMWKRFLTTFNVVSLAFLSTMLLAAIVLLKGFKRVR